MVIVPMVATFIQRPPYVAWGGPCMITVAIGRPYELWLRLFL